MRGIWGRDGRWAMGGFNTAAARNCKIRVRFRTEPELFRLVPRLNALAGGSTDRWIRGPLTTDAAPHAQTPSLLSAPDSNARLGSRAGIDAVRNAGVRAQGRRAERRGGQTK